TAHRQMGHVLRALLSEPQGEELVAGPERSVEEDAPGIGERVLHFARDASHGREVGEEAPAGGLANPQADVVLGVGWSQPFEVDRRLSGNGHRLDEKPGSNAVRPGEVLLATELQGAPGHLFGETLE